jgi:glycosyltransferase involved in cell wall biosynthesis
MREDITVVILTNNESLHLRRAIESVRSFASEIIVVDSFSTDDTCAIAGECGARVLQRTFVHQADQLQWAMDNAGISTTWVMRLDADEYVMPALAGEIQARLPELPGDVCGIVLTRRLHFMGRWIRHGGYYPVRLLRIWRHGAAAVEQRQMDEHIYLLKGSAIRLSEDFVDENLQTLSWWTGKHNQYATREAAEWLSKRYGFMASHSLPGKDLPGGQAAVKRWYKRNLYDRMPLLIRAFLYFHYRYILRLGFLDGRQGLIWHFLQGFWYRFLVDAKIIQILRIARVENMKIEDVLSARMGLRGLQETSPVINKEAE